MKKLTLLCATLSLNAMAQIPNGGFENWTDLKEQPELEQWFTSNWITSMFGIISAGPGSPAPEGDFHLTLVSSDLMEDAMTGFAITSFPYVDRPTTFSGMVRYSTSPTDPALASIYFTRWNADEGTSDVVGAAEMLWTGELDQWEDFEMPIDYFSDLSPDSAHIVLFSSVGEEISAANWIHFDALALDLNVGITRSTITELQIFPVPAESSLTLTAAVPMREVQILSTEGRHIRSEQNNGLSTTIDVSGLSAGTYLVRAFLSDGTTVVKRVVKK
jgi:hypothetical protein